MKIVFALVFCLILTGWGYVPVQAQEACKVQVKAGEPVELEYFRLLGCLEGQLAVARKNRSNTSVLEGQLARLKALKSLTPAGLQEAMDIPVQTSVSSTTIYTWTKLDTTDKVARPEEIQGEEVAPGTKPEPVVITQETKKIFDTFLARQREVISGKVRAKTGQLLYHLEPNWKGTGEEFRHLVLQSNSLADLERTVGHWRFRLDGTPNGNPYRLVEGEYYVLHPHYLRQATGFQTHFKDGVLERVTANMLGGTVTIVRQTIDVGSTQLWKPGMIAYQLVWRNPDAYLPENAGKSRSEDENPLRDRYKTSASLSLSNAQEATLYSVVESRTASRHLKAVLSDNKYQVEVNVAGTLHAPYNYSTYYVLLIPKGK